jgi:hypothetical protein
VCEKEKPTRGATDLGLDYHHGVMKIHHLLYFVLSLLSTATCSILDQEEFTTFVDDLLTEWNTPGGVSVAFVQKDASSSSSRWTVETAGFGNASRYGDRMTATSQLCIASNSKVNYLAQFARYWSNNNAAFHSSSRWHCIGRPEGSISARIQNQNLQSHSRLVHHA